MKGPRNEPRIIGSTSEQITIQDEGRKTKGSIRMYSSSAMPSSNDIVRGRYPRRQYMSKFNPNLSKHSGMTEIGQTQHLGRSLPPLKVMTQNLTWQRSELEKLIHESAPPALLYRMQLNNDQMMNLSQRKLNSTNQSMPGVEILRVGLEVDTVYSALNT